MTKHCLLSNLLSAQIARWLECLTLRRKISGSILASSYALKCMVGVDLGTSMRLTASGCILSINVINKVFFGYQKLLQYQIFQPEKIFG